MRSASANERLRRWWSRTSRHWATSALDSSAGGPAAKHARRAASPPSPRGSAKRGMTICEAAMIETDYGFEQGYAAMDQIIEGLDRADRPTAVVCGNDYLA